MKNNFQKQEMTEKQNKGKGSENRRFSD